jgi:hypothetical protein
VGIDRRQTARRRAKRDMKHATMHDAWSSNRRSRGEQRHRCWIAGWYGVLGTKGVRNRTVIEDSWDFASFEVRKLGTRKERGELVGGLAVFRIGL